ncbi:hypothetical protein ACJX0J_022230, partial [Zea mays]
KQAQEYIREHNWPGLQGKLGKKTIQHTNTNCNDLTPVKNTRNSITTQKLPEGNYIKLREARGVPMHNEEKKQECGFSYTKIRNSISTCT